MIKSKTSKLIKSYIDSFEEKVLKSLYFSKISEIKKFSLEKEITDAFLTSLKENSQKLSERVESYIKSQNFSTEEHACPTSTNEDSTNSNFDCVIKKNTANVKFNFHL